MASITVNRRPNAFKIVPIPEKKKIKYPALGQELLHKVFENVNIVAPSGSGKTTWIFNVLMNCCGPRTTVLAFSNSAESDSSWDGIKEWLNENKIRHVIDTDIIDDEKNNLIQEFIDWRVQVAKTEKEIAKQSKLESVLADKNVPFGGFMMQLAEEKKERPFLGTIDRCLVEKDGVTYEYPLFIVIVDDLSHRMKNPAIQTLIRMYRHMKCKLIISSQYSKDNSVGGRSNVSSILIWGGINRTRIKELYETSGCKLTFEEFFKLYLDAVTPTPELSHPYLHVDISRRLFSKSDLYDYDLQ